MSTLLARSGGQGVIRNAVALWTVQFFRKTLPLITIPYLARMLGPDGWGLVAMFQSLAASVALLLEFGFELGATRQVARCRESSERLSEVIGGVFGVQGALALGATVFVFLLRDHVALLRNHPALTGFCLLFGFAEAFNPVWYFVGVERMSVPAAIEICSKSVGAAAIFLLVRSRQDAVTVLAIQAAVSTLSLLASLWLINRQVPFRLPSLALVRGALRGALPMFLIRGGECFYTMGNAFLLGFFAGPTVVGYFAGPEKIARALAGLFNPVRQALYPRLSKLMVSSPGQAARLARIGTTFTGLGGLAVGAFVYLAAPLLIRIGFGPGFEPAVDVLRLLAVLPPLISITQSAGMQWLLPSGRERAVVRTVLSAGLLNVLLVLVLVPRLAHTGMAFAVICSEAFVCAVLTGTALVRPKGGRRSQPIEAALLP